MFGKTGLVGILTAVNERHLSLVNQIVEKLGKEFSEPPHANQVTAGRIVRPFPAVFLTLIELLGIVITIASDHTQVDFFVNSGVKCKISVLLKLSNHESLIILHDGGFLGNICKKRSIRYECVIYFEV